MTRRDLNHNSEPDGLGAVEALVILLAITTGALDATTFERLGNVFASVITGTCCCWAWAPPEAKAG